MNTIIHRKDLTAKSAKKTKVSLKEKDYHNKGKKVIKLFQAIIVIYMSALSSSCGDLYIDNPTVELTGDYLPLAVGNQWVFTPKNSPANKYLVQVVGTKQLGEHFYAVVISKTLYSSSGDTAYYRVNAEGKLLINWRGSEYLFADFSRREGESWDSYGGYKATVRKKGVTLNTPISSFSNCVEILYDAERAADDEQWLTFSPGFGFVGIRSAWLDFDLDSAIINGNRYPSEK